MIHLNEKLKENGGLQSLYRALIKLDCVNEHLNDLTNVDINHFKDGYNALNDFCIALLSLFDARLMSNGTQLSSTDAMYKSYLEFKEKYGHEPKFAHVGIRWNGDKEIETEWIKLRDFNEDDTANDPDDKNVVFYCRGIKELLEINAYGMEDFRIVQFYKFHDEYEPW